MAPHAPTLTPRSPALAPEADARTQAHAKAGPAPDETAFEKVRRWVLGIAYALQPQRISSLPHLMLWTALDTLAGGTEIPDQARTRSRPDSFGGVVRDLSPKTYLAALRLGFFPWCHCGPLKWWTRKERMVLFLPELHTGRTLKRLLRSGKYRFTFDTAFDDVVAACSAPRDYNWHTLTWITPRFRRLFSELHREGHAHSFEVWNDKGELVGGGFGTAVGRIFVGESMFSREPNTSKLGGHVLSQHLVKWGFVLADARDHTPVLKAAGYRKIPRAEYEALLAAHATSGDRTGPWAVDPAIVAPGKGE